MPQSEHEISTDRARCPTHQPLFSDEKCYSENNDILTWSTSFKATNTKFAKHSTGTYGHFLKVSEKRMWK